MISASGFTALACAFATGACVSPPEPTWWVEFRGPQDAELVLDGVTHRLPCEIVVEPERALPLELQLGEQSFTGWLALGYAPRAKLVAEFDARLVEAAAVEPLTLFGWTNDFLGECELAFVAGARGSAVDELAARELAERYTGAASSGELAALFGWSIVAALTRSSAVPSTTIEARHVAGAAWIDDRGVAHGLHAGDALAFVRTRDSRAWIGPLRARDASAASEAPELEADLAAALPPSPLLSTFAVGDGRHGTLAMSLAWTQDEPGAARLRLDARLDPETAQIAIVVVERGTPSALSSTAARVVAGDHRVIVWSPGADECARGPLELSWRRTAVEGAP